jgi:hypothetical protein
MTQPTAFVAAHLTIQAYFFFPPAFVFLFAAAALLVLSEVSCIFVAKRFIISYKPRKNHPIVQLW